MTVDEFLAAVNREGVDDRSFSLTGGLPSEQYVLEKQREGDWAVYYSERGHKNGLNYFNFESDALEHLLQTLLRDPTTRKTR